MTARSKKAKSNKADGRPATRANNAMQHQIMSSDKFSSPRLRKAAYYADYASLVFNMDVRDVLALLAREGFKVNCIVTSPPFYGQRDYESETQIVLDEHPAHFFRALADIFDNCGD